MKIAICEDELLFAKELLLHIQVFFQKKNIEPEIIRFSNEQAALKLCGEANLYDLIFMDINLGGQSDGVEISRKLREQAPKIPIIFITSLENRAIDGYDVDAFGFVVKKNYKEKLPVVLEKLWKQLYNAKTLTITEKNEVHLLNVKDILWVESDGRNSLVHTVDAAYTDVHSIRNMAPALEYAGFIECFKSVFVNVEKIKSVNTDTITLINGHKLPVSRRSRKNVMLAVMKKVREQ